MIIHGAHPWRCFGGDTNSFSFCVGFNVPPQIGHSAVDGRIEKRRVRPVLVQVREQLFAYRGVGQWNIQLVPAGGDRLHGVRSANDSDCFPSQTIGKRLILYFSDVSAISYSCFEATQQFRQLL
jgi:hypothetical protein